VLDFTKCSLCGSCVEACRDGAIRYSHEYNLASTNKDDYIMDLFKRLETERLEAERVEGSLKSEVHPSSAVAATEEESLKSEGPLQETKSADQSSTLNPQPPTTPK